MAGEPQPALQGKDRWAAKSLRSGFGRQVRSEAPTNPGVSFGSADCDGFKKTYVSPEADRAKAKAEGGSNSPGPVYKVQETMGRQFLSTMHSNGVATFGTARREGMAKKGGPPGPGAYKSDDAALTRDSTHSVAGRVKFATASRDQAGRIYISAEHDKTSGGRDSPGPSAYNTDSQRAQDMLSERHRDPAFSMGSGQRSDPTGSRAQASNPGVGQYDVPAGLGRQVPSTKKSTAVVRFSRAGRDAVKKIYISPEHDKTSAGDCSPGPTTAGQRPPYGPQQLSRHRTAPAVGFARSTRLRNYGTLTPGPGEYDA